MEQNTEQGQLLAKMKGEVLECIDSIAQGRSTHQIEKFVVGSHDTQERQYTQCLTELHIKLNNIKRDEIALRRLKKKVEVEKDDDERELLLLQIEELVFSLKSQMREAGVLYSLFNNMPKFTYQQIQEAEEKYWQLRLARQSEMDLIQRNTGISVGNAEALRQTGMLQPFLQHIHRMQLEASTEQQKALSQ